MTEEIIKIIKDAEKQRHNNHIQAGKQNWEQVRREAKKEVYYHISKILKKWDYSHYPKECITELKNYIQNKRHLPTFAEQKRHNNDLIKSSFTEVKRRMKEDKKNSTEMPQTKIETFK